MMFFHFKISAEFESIGPKNDFMIGMKWINLYSLHRMNLIPFNCVLNLIRFCVKVH